MSDEIDKLLLDHKNKLMDHLHAAYHNPSLREDSPQYYVDLHKETAKAIEAYISKRELELLDNFVEDAKILGFERYDLVVEYQDGTNSGVIPFREHWNIAYDKFLVAIDWYKEKLNIGD